MGDGLEALFAVIMLVILTLFCISIIIAPLWMLENYIEHDCESWKISERHLPESCLTPRLKGEDDE